MIGIFDVNGDCVVTYNWDNAWGYNPEPDGPMADTLGILNPLRYRSYVYDEETGYYYLQSRYYDPEICRFINADLYISSGDGFIGNNMFAYCVNSPTNYLDKGGEFLCTIIGAVVGAACGAVDALIQGRTGKEFTASVLSGATSGAVTGAVSDVLLITGGSAAVVVAATAGASALGTITGAVVESAVTQQDINLKDTLTDAAFDAATGALFGYMSGPITSGLKTKGLAKVAKSVLRNEVHDIGTSIAEEALSNVTAGIMTFTKDVFVRQLKNTVAVCMK